MFTEQQSDFIKSLAEDYIRIGEKQKSQNSSPKLMSDPTPRKAGSTDYAKFDNIAANVQYEEDVAVFNDEQKQYSVFCKVDHVHGPSCKPIAPGCNHDLSQERMIYEKPLREKLETILMFREEGNKAFKNRQFSEAATAYNRALIYLDYSFGETDEENDAIDAERVKNNLNLAAVHLELEEYAKVVNHCRLALRVDPNNSKAYYRRGIAHLRLAELESAQADLYKAVKLISLSDKDARRSVEIAIHELNAKWNEYKKKSGDFAKAAVS